MKNERLVRAIGKIDDDLIYNAVNDVKTKKKGGWLKWVAAAACLCVAIVVISVIYDTGLDFLVSNNDEVQIGSTADYPAMVMINGKLYRDSWVLTFPDSLEEDGKIVSSCNEVPTDNDQSNFGTGYSYQYGEDDTIIVLLDEGWHIFVPTDSNRNMDMEGLTEQKKMEMDPYYNVD